MCGFVGFIGQSSAQNELQCMLDVLDYRGPDDSGFHIQELSEKFIHLGQNRLAIQDTSKKGHQPFLSDCGNFILVFNGEVYNFKDIKSELEKLGQRFVSKSDTEVILYAYKHWGIQCIHRFIGMFAFALLDINNQKLFLVRDRVGVKPLYYYQNDGVFLFSSELKSFHQHPEFVPKLNKSVLTHYFQLGYIPAPDSIFKNTYKLLPGHYIEMDLGQCIDGQLIESDRVDVRKYWDVVDHYKAEKWKKSEHQLESELEVLLKDSLKLRMVSDVPVGVFLSGGYDSSLVTSLLSKDKQKLKTFTIGFKDKEFNEAKHAKLVANHFNTHHHELYLDPQIMLDDVESLPWFFDEPFGDSSALPTMQVAKLAREKVTVGVSADGGDEVFCGYSKYFALQRFNSFRKSLFKRSLLKAGLLLLNKNILILINRLLPKKRQITNLIEKREKLLRAITSKSQEEMFMQASSYANPQDVESILKSFKGISGFFKFEDDLSLLQNMMVKDYKTFLVDDVLTKVDRSTMSVSLEGREPLLDHRIIEFMARVPDHIKFKNGQGKYLLRKILYKHIPKNIVDKPKSGFQIPLAKWLRSDLKLKVDEFISTETLDPHLFNVDEVIKVKHAFYMGQDEKASLIWFLLVFQIWREQWNV